MNKIVLDRTALTRLGELKERAEVCDESGTVVGVFIPSPDSSLYEIIDPPTEDELDASAAQADRARPLADFMKDLQEAS